MSLDDGVAGPVSHCTKWSCENAPLIVVWDQVIKPQAICPKCGACYGKANARWLMKQETIPETRVQRKLKEMKENSFHRAFLCLMCGDQSPSGENCPTCNAPMEWIGVMVAWDADEEAMIFERGIMAFNSEMRAVAWFPSKKALTKYFNLDVRHHYVDCSNGEVVSL